MRKIGIKEIKLVQLSILSEVASFCDRNEIKYWLDGGTLIGAVRHKGYIPWDDDIDIGMLRADYIKFSNLFNAANKQYRFISCELGSSPFPYGKVIDSNTVLYEPDENGFKTSINIDIFPYDDAPCDEKEIKRLFDKRDRYLKLYVLQEGLIMPNKTWKKLIKKISKVILSVIPKGYFAKKEVENAGSYNGRGCSLVGNFCGVTRAICDKTISDETIDAVFEGKFFKIPKRYHEWLTTFYGDYMTLPPEEERVNHGTSVAFVLE